MHPNTLLKQNPSWLCYGRIPDDYIVLEPHALHVEQQGFPFYHLFSVVTEGIAIKKEVKRQLLSRTNPGP